MLELAEKAITIVITTIFYMFNRLYVDMKDTF